MIYKSLAAAQLIIFTTTHDKIERGVKPIYCLTLKLSSVFKFVIDPLHLKTFHGKAGLD